MLSLRATSSPPPILADVACFFDALERLPTFELVALARTDVSRIGAAVGACTRAAYAHALQDPMDGAELASCRWADRRMLELHAAVRGLDAPPVALTRRTIGVVQVLAQWTASAIVVRDVVPRDVYEMATSPFFGFVPVPASRASR